MKKIIIISVVILFLAGCGPAYEVEILGGSKYYMTLEEALADAMEPDSYNIYGNNAYLGYLQNLWRQAYAKDKRIIERKKLDFLLKQAEMYGPDWHNFEFLREQATNEEVKITIDRKLSEYRQAQREQTQQETEERERLEHEQAERERIEFETKRKELIQNSNGTLRDKSAQQVKKLVDGWREGSWRWQERAKFFSVETFYKVFGQPDRTQFISALNCYYFWYNCKDGVVQIKVHAEQLDDNSIVLIQDLNIF